MLYAAVGGALRCGAVHLMRCHQREEGAGCLMTGRHSLGATRAAGVRSAVSGVSPAGLLLQPSSDRVKPHSRTVQESVRRVG